MMPPKNSGTVLVAGGGGYIGSVLCRELLDRGFTVKVIDRFFYGRSGLQGIEKSVECVEKDIRKLTVSDLEDVDACVNLAGLSNDPLAEFNPEANWDMNALGAEHLARVCRDAGVKRHLLASSASVYDRGGMTEEEDQVLTEESEVQPKAAYALSKLEAEKRVLALAGDDFCPAAFRKGTVYGFSPRMRYDLVVNTFLKDALSAGRINLVFGGEMWRPMVNISDAARAYVLALQAPEEKIKGEVFNVVGRNFRISELGLHVRETLKKSDKNASLEVDYSYRTIRSYRVSARKIRERLNWEPCVSVEDSVKTLLQKIQEFNYTNFEHPRYYNVEWMKLLQETQDVSSPGPHKDILKAPEDGAAEGTIPFPSSESR